MPTTKTKKRARDESPQPSTAERARKWTPELTQFLYDKVQTMRENVDLKMSDIFEELVTRFPKQFGAFTRAALETQWYATNKQMAAAAPAKMPNDTTPWPEEEEKALYKLVQVERSKEPPTPWAEIADKHNAKYGDPERTTAACQVEPLLSCRASHL